MAREWGIHWFRRDLRIAGNAALRENWKRTQGRTLGLFCFDSKFLARSDFSNNRFAFFLKTLKALRREFVSMGGDLWVVDRSPQDFFRSLFENGIQDLRSVSWGRDYEPFARQRDQAVQSLLHERGVEIFTERDHLLFEPEEIRKEDASFYQVYSPFGRKWFERLNSELGQSRIHSQNIAAKIFSEKKPPEKVFRLSWKDVCPSHFLTEDQLDHFEKENSSKVSIPIPEAGFHEAYAKLLEFKSKITEYQVKRDIPSLSGTSRLSVYLKNGSLTVPQVLQALGTRDLQWSQSSGLTQFVKELAWREFYYQILFHRPEVEKKSFLPQFEHLPWENREDFFSKWKEGMTGFPIVDAGMRELKTTGWMHNRVRMIVASFLCKDLLIDWRWGEKHFMHQLLDGDLAPNNGGWQWAASTGCDPQPYFRIFNPWLQSEKFDPSGDYIRKFVPELRAAPVQVLHDPEADRSVWKYPEPMVDHTAQKAKALKLYKK